MNRNSFRYSDRMKELSTMYRDRPVDTMDNAHYWVEYVVKHHKSLMRSLGIKRTWYERRLLDVYFVIGQGQAVVTLSLVFAAVFFKVLKFCFTRKLKLE